MSDSQCIYCSSIISPVSLMTQFCEYVSLLYYYYVYIDTFCLQVYCVPNEIRLLKYVYIFTLK